MNTNNVCAPINNSNHWNHINWTLCEKYVRNLQVRIVKAWKEERYNKAKSLQRILVKSFSAKALSVKRVTENKGKRTAGIDNVLWDTPKQKYNAINTLTSKGYHCLPLRRIYIPKKNGKKRPLGIPTMKDRAMQTLYLFALQPIAETTADNCSYGFRPQRSTHDAIEHCFKLLSKKYSATWILEGDIKGCFDHISHQWLMDNIPIDKKMLHQWLKAGAVFQGEHIPTTEGTMQGGTISPTLANMALDGLEKILRDKFKQVNRKGTMYNPKVKLVKYADDFIVTGDTKEILENEVLPIIKTFLAKRGLEISDEKTKITHINDGFNFLGQNIRKYNGKLLIKPSKQSQLNILQKLSQIIKENYSCKQDYLIIKLNQVLKGWCEYHKYAVSSKAFYKLDHLLWQKLWSWCVRRHPNKGKHWIKNKYFRHLYGQDWVFSVKYKDKYGKEEYHVLKRAGNVKIKRHTMIKYESNPFDEEWDTYFEERAGFKMINNPTKRKSLVRLWKSQNGCCKICRDKIDKVSGWCLHTDKINMQKFLLHPKCHSYIHSLQSGFN